MSHQKRGAHLESAAIEARPRRDRASRAWGSAVLALALFSLLPINSAHATLVGVKITFPKITFQNTSTNALTYNATTQLFSIDAAPIAVLFSASESPRLVTGIKSLTIRALVDNTGA
ncbi:MAG: hypothetical protein DME25_01910, partial [Verrucomicrobia bacterium]